MVVSSGPYYINIFRPDSTAVQHNDFFIVPSFFLRPLSCRLEIDPQASTQSAAIFVFIFHRNGRYFHLVPVARNGPKDQGSFLLSESTRPEAGLCS